MNLGIEIWKTTEAPPRILAVPHPGPDLSTLGEYCCDLRSLDYSFDPEDRSLDDLEARYGVRVLHFANNSGTFSSVRVFGSENGLHTLLVDTARRAADTAEARARADLRVREPRLGLP